MIGDFSGVLRGRYELLWIVAVLAVVGYVAADRFTVAGMGEDFATNLGLNYAAVLRLGLAIVALVTAVVVVIVGAVPFLGLVVPNLVSLLFGDRRPPRGALGGGVRRRVRAAVRHHRPHHPLPVRDSRRHGDGVRRGQRHVPVVAAARKDG